VNDNTVLTAILPVVITITAAFSLFSKTPSERKSLSDRLFRRRARAEDILVSEIRCGLESVVSRSRYFRNQISLLTTAVRQNASRSLPLEESEAKRFNENSRNIDLLAQRYTILSSHLAELLDHEEAITSPDLLQKHREKEFETISQLSALSDQIEPLLSENEQIAAYVVSVLR